AGRPAIVVGGAVWRSGASWAAATRLMPPRTADMVRLRLVANEGSPAGGDYLDDTSDRSSSPSPLASAAGSAATTPGSNCVPAQATISATASSGSRGRRYGRSGLTIAS